MKIVLNLIIAKPAAAGGFNVAINFFKQTLDDKGNEWIYFVSKDFDRVMRGKEKGLDEKHYFVFHTQPNIKFYNADRKIIKRLEFDIKPDVIFSLLAPSYHMFKTTEVMYHANAWAVVGGVNKFVLNVTPFKQRITYRIKAMLTRWLMKKTKFFITQTQIAKKCILNTVDTTADNVCVVSNVLPSSYFNISNEKKQHEGFNMVYASSPAVHKDYLILPEVASILINRFAMKDFKIHYTLPDNVKEYPILMSLIKHYDVENYFVNHGYLNQSDLAEVFKQSDLGLFPSLLETFSGTLLEYMYFRLPIIASDFDFNKEVAEDAAVYFSPHNAEDMAKKIYKVYSDDNLRVSLLKNAKERLIRYSNNADKYGETIGFLRKAAELNRK